MTISRILACLLFAVILRAQTQGELTGQVSDSTGGAVAGAQIAVTNVGTGAIRVVTANGGGLYGVPSLPPGVYNVKVEANGFQTVQRNAVELQVQQTARLDFEMQVGRVSEVVQVSGGAPQLNTEDATVGEVIENRRIENLPLNGRNFLQLVALSPNVSFGFSSNTTAVGRQGGQRATQNIAISGQRSEFNYFSLDGVDNTDVSFNIYIFLPSIDALQEFKVQSGVFGAEFGRATGQVNVSTKPGSNNYHGTLFEFLRNSALDASTYSFTAVHPLKNPFKRNQFGFTLGGPVSIPKLFNGRDRLFFMANYEGLRDRLGVRSVGSVPSAAMRTGDFSGRAAIYDPASRLAQSGGAITAQQFAGNRIPVSRQSQRALQLLNYYPAPNVPGAGLTNNYQVTQGQNMDADQFNIRLDFIESASSSWFGRYSSSSELQLTPAIFPQQGSKLQSDPKQIVLANTRTLNPSLVNEFRFGYNRFINKNLNYNAGVLDVVGQLGGIAGVATPFPDIYGIPNIVLSGFTGFGDPDFLPFIDRNNTFQWIDSMSMIRGKHSFRFGAEIRRDRFNELGNSFVRGEFAFNGQVTQNPQAPVGTGIDFADYLLGMPYNSSSALRLADTQLRATSQAYFVEDSWKVAPKLTLTLGLRYENTPPYYDKHDSIVNALVTSIADPSQSPTLIRPGTGDFYEGTPFVFGPGVKVARGNNLMGRTLVARDNNDFAPRIGLAYSPTSKWTVRAGFGTYYVQDAGNTRFDLGRNLAGRAQDVTNANFPDLTLYAPFHNLGGSATVLATPFVLANMYNRRTPYVSQYVLNVQRQLAQNLLLEVGYLGNEGHKLERLRILNDPPAGPGAVQARRPWPAYAGVQEVEGSVNSNYNSLAVKLQQRYAHGITGVFAYTWSRSIDTGSAIRAHVGDPLYPQDSYNVRSGRGLSTFQVGQRTVGSLLWELPFGNGRRWLNAGGVSDIVLGGWQIGSIVTLQTGFPLTPLIGKDVANNGEGAYQRPDATGIDPRLPVGQRIPQHWFNTGAFTTPALYTFGNTGRNTVIGPGLVNWDSSLFKQFPTRENQHFELRAEAFNLTNHPNWGSPNMTLTSASFGAISSTSTTMRQVQFALKYVF